MMNNKSNLKIIIWLLFFGFIHASSISPSETTISNQEENNTENNIENNADIMENNNWSLDIILKDDTELVKTRKPLKIDTKLF